jgi:hypothetical protein
MALRRSNSSRNSTGADEASGFGLARTQFAPTRRVRSYGKVKMFHRNIFTFRQETCGATIARRFRLAILARGGIAGPAAVLSEPRSDLRRCLEFVVAVRECRNLQNTC